MIHWKCDSPVKSSIGERARGWRRRDFEKKRIKAGKEEVSLWLELRD